MSLDKVVDDSTTRGTLPFHTDPQIAKSYVNPRGDVRFGLLLEYLDTLAAQVAIKHCAGSPIQKVVTASVDRIDLLHPISIANDLRITAQINYAGGSSMEIGLRLAVEAQGRQHNAACCRFTFVGLDSAGKPAPVPALLPRMPAEHKRFAEAAQRRAEFKQSRAKPPEPPTHQEFLLWNALMAQPNPGIPMSATAHERVILMYPQRQNPNGDIFGGFLMRLAYEDAWNAAYLHSGERPMIASVDRVNFVRPVQIGELLKIKTRISYVGTSSMGVESVLATIEPKSRAETLTNACYFTIVAVDAHRTPMPVPKVCPQTYDEFYHASPDQRLEIGYLFGHRRYERNKALRPGSTP